MQVTVESLEGLERKISVQLPWEEFNEKFQQKLNELKPTIKMDGFRKGKAPEKVIKQRYGSAIQGDVLNELIRQHLPKALEQEELNPAGMPILEELTDIEEGKPIQFVAKFEVMPEVAVKDLSGVTITKQKVVVSDTDVDEALEGLRKQKTTWSEVDRASKEGDQLVIDFDGSVDGEAFEGNSATDFSIVIGDKRMIPGFEEGLVGLKTEAEHDLEVTFPEEYQVKELAAKLAVFKITVKKVSEPKLPELDEAFVKEWGIEDGDAGKLKEEIKSGLEREARQVVVNNLREQVFDKLLELNNFDVPNVMIDHEIKRMHDNNMREMESRYGLKESVDAPRDLYENGAKRGVALSLLMSQVIKDHDIKADADKVRVIMESQATAYENPEQIINYFYQNDQMLKSFEAQALEEQVIDKMLETAIVEEKESSYAEVTKPQEPKEEKEK